MSGIKAEFVGSAVKPDQYPRDRLPEIALAGRSNVGKSSLINQLVNRRKLAHTSGNPGKTRTINFYRVEDRFYLADMPGYGFARVPKTVKIAWGRMIEHYLMNRKELKGIIHVIDLRHSPTKDDQQMYDWLKHMGIPAIVVATKADKIAHGRWQKHLKLVREELLLRSDDPLILFSAQSGQGKDQLWNAIHNWL